MKKLTDADLEILANLMDDDLREQVNRELAPCTNEAFLARYLQLDPGFSVSVKQETQYDPCDL